MIMQEFLAQLILVMVSNKIAPFQYELHNVTYHIICHICTLYFTTSIFYLHIELPDLPEPTPEYITISDSDSDNQTPANKR